MHAFDESHRCGWTRACERHWLVLGTQVEIIQRFLTSAHTYALRATVAFFNKLECIFLVRAFALFSTLRERKLRPQRREQIRVHARGYKSQETIGVFIRIIDDE